MIRARQLDHIVRTTLRRMGVTDSSMVRLIKGTFLYESDLELLYDYSNEHNKRRGLMMMDDRTIERVFNDYMKFRKPLVEAVESATGAIINGSTVVDMKQDLEYNVALMVAFTHAFYSSKFTVPPKDDLHDIASYYRTYYHDMNDPSVDEDFIEYYKEVFTDK